MGKELKLILHAMLRTILMVLRFIAFFIILVGPMVVVMHVIGYYTQSIQAEWIAGILFAGFYLITMINYTELKGQK
jgi:hypothetical protein